MEEEKKRKAEEERMNYIELEGKLQENLGKESDILEDSKVEEEPTISLNYKLYRNLVKETNPKLTGYQDYQESLRISREKKAKGEYDKNNIIENTNIPTPNFYNKFIKNVVKINTYIDSEGKISKKNNPFVFFKK